MSELFQYPMPFPGWWLDYYYYVTWSLSMLFLAAGWAVFYRYGKFSYGVDFGCLWKTTLLVAMTTVALGVPQYYNTRFSAEHGNDGDSVRLAQDRVEYRFRNGVRKQFLYKDIVSIYQEPVTYNPPAKVFIVAHNAGLRDSLFVTEGVSGLPRSGRLLEELGARTGLAVKRP
ncbi:MAG: hypothetical protein HGB29_03440 [Chlorobiaceae bacterium]|nr:hypothetical protein [Chlorobiaceae bacterium]NTW73896.1 hypothetical protein [Chlorobiaceae bacterium]